MRRLGRHGLERPLARFLEKYAARATAGGRPIEALWKQCRRTVALKRVFETLEKGGGVSKRCYYCSRSPIQLIDHFVPKASSPELAFAWANMIGSCATCNLAKGTVQDIIRPTFDDPWIHIVFIEATGLYVAVVNKNIEDAKGRRTLEIFSFLNDEDHYLFRLASLEHLRSLSKRLMLTPSDENILKEFRRATILVSPSVWEWFFEFSNEGRMVAALVPDIGSWLEEPQ